MIALRPFSKSDWYGLAGAEAFPDGSAPLLGELRVSGISKFPELAAEVILDAGGLALQAYSEEGDVVFVVHFDPLYAARAVALLNDGVSLFEIEAMPGAEFHSWSTEALGPVVRVAS